VLAIEHFQTAVKLDEKATAPWVGIAVSLAALGRSESSIRIWKEVITRDPSHGDALLILGLDAARIANHELAQTYLAQRWLQQEDEPLEAILRDAALISASKSLGDDDLVSKLQQSFQPILDEATNDLVNGATSIIWRGILQQLIDVNATHVALQLAVAGAPLVHGQELATLLSALPVLEAATDGDGSLTKKTYEDVTDESGVLLSPRWFEPVPLAEALSTAAQTMTIHGAIDAPILLYEAAVLLEPTNPLIVNNLAWTRMLRDGATERVVALSKKAIELDPNATYIKDTVGWMYVLQGQPEKGIPYFIEALGQSNQPNPEIYDHLGDAYWVLGQQSNAMHSWQMAATLLHSAGTRKNAIEGYASLENSVWGISVATPEALYDLELGEVARVLMKKLAAVVDGKTPPVGIAASTDGVK